MSRRCNEGEGAGGGEEGAGGGGEKERASRERCQHSNLYSAPSVILGVVDTLAQDPWVVSNTSTHRHIPFHNVSHKGRTIITRVHVLVNCKEGTIITHVHLLVNCEEELSYPVCTCWWTARENYHNPCPFFFGELQEGTLTFRVHFSWTAREDPRITEELWRELSSVTTEDGRATSGTFRKNHEKQPNSLGNSSEEHFRTFLF